MDSSNLIGKYPLILIYNQLFIKLNQFIALEAFAIEVT